MIFVRSFSKFPYKNSLTESRLPRLVFFSFGLPYDQRFTLRPAISSSTEKAQDDIVTCVHKLLQTLNVLLRNQQFWAPFSRLKRGCPETMFSETRRNNPVNIIYEALSPYLQTRPPRLLHSSVTTDDESVTTLGNQPSPLASLSQSVIPCLHVREQKPARRQQVLST